MNKHPHNATRTEDPATQDEAVLLNKRHPIGGAFVAVRPDGSVRAGYTEHGARVYDSARAACDYFRDVYESIDHHGAGNIYHLLSGRMAR